MIFWSFKISMEKKDSNSLNTWICRIDRSIWFKQTRSWVPLTITVESALHQMSREFAFAPLRALTFNQYYCNNANLFNVVRFILFFSFIHSFYYILFCFSILFSTLSSRHRIVSREKTKQQPIEYFAFQLCLIVPYQT